MMVKNSLERRRLNIIIIAKQHRTFKQQQQRQSINSRKVQIQFNAVMTTIENYRKGSLLILPH